MNPKKIELEKTAVASNVFTTLTATAAACCSGPGLIACSSSCAPSCGSLIYSVFGLSSSALTDWLSQYWYAFLFFSLISFAFAFYKLFVKPNCKTSRISKATFILCLGFSSIIVIKSFLVC